MINKNNKPLNEIERKKQEEIEQLLEEIWRFFKPSNLMNLVGEYIIEFPNQTLKNQLNLH
mgnify:CR=1 FL=1